MKYVLKLIVFLFITPFAYTQSEKGIRFDHEHSWQEVLQKAKADNKLIYVDVYTTWCGPCRQMAAQVFPKKEVGDFYNTNFINFKAQIDTGRNDADYIKARYADFGDIAKNYDIEVYPTHLFINGDGELVHRALGAILSVEYFIRLGENALNPDKQYGTLKKKFEAGDRPPPLLANLIKAASQAADEKLKSEALDAYMATQQDLLTEENIRLLYDATESFDNKSFKIIRDNPEKFDQVLGEGKVFQKYMYVGYRDLLLPRMMEEKKKELDFSALRKALQKKVGEKYLDELVDGFKLDYYMSLGRWKDFEKVATIYEGRYLSAPALNQYAWYIFENKSDKPLLQKALQWALKSVEKEDKAYNNDTVANLYYKLNQKDKAVEYQRKALDLARKEGIEPEEYEKTLEKFKSGK